MKPSDNISIPVVTGLDTRPHVLGMTVAELEALLSGSGQPAYRARQVREWLYARRAGSYAGMTTLGKPLRELLESISVLRTLSLLERQISGDGTIKYLFGTRDGLRIESVLIPSEARDDQHQPRRRTLCISTQVGCPLDCKFCATATMRLKRNLTAGEILEQFLVVESDSGQAVTNVVYMGMGEPMLNYDEVFRSVGILTDPENALVSAGRVTVSTSGLPGGIRRMADEGQRVKLAISLHALTDGLRSRLMPVNRRHNLRELMDAVEYYYRKTRRPVTYEYILFDGLNDTPEDVKRLARIARRVPGKVNVIPFHDIAFTNPTGIAAELRATAPENFDRFVGELRLAGVQVMVRSSSGQDIEAACGQLAVGKGVL